MNRRQLLALPLAAMNAQTPKKLVKPAALQSGDVVGLITPASNVVNSGDWARIEQTMKGLGLEPRYGKNIRRKGYVAGTIEDRVADLHDMFRDPAVKGVFAIRGGYGTPQLLDKIDYDLLRKNPKVFCGYSDITALHLAFHQKLGLVTFHGPTANAKFPPFTLEHFRKALFDTAPIGKLTNPAEGHTLRAIRPGTARGRIVVGNLSLISNLMGTPYEIDTRDKILLLEDVGEEAFRIDRMLTQLKLAGKLDRIAGVVWGECEKCKPTSGVEVPLTEREVVDRILGGLGVPVLSGLTFGHTDNQLTLPQGVMATLDSTAGTLTLEESALASR
ncbi:MAG: LD-carboxypeptidase [Bryobacteraceae bacterium]|nr:LD-carboxypeptidase [Bryobacteraceae bacterium]